MFRFPVLRLRSKIILLALACLLVGVGIFSYLGTRAIDRSTDKMLEERLTTARLVADYVDEVLGRALLELVTTAQTISIDQERSEVKGPVESLQNTYSVLSIATDDIFLLDENGRVVWSISGDASIFGLDLSTYGGVNEALSDNRAAISGLVSGPMTNTPLVFLASPTRVEAGGRVGVLAAALDLARSNIGGFIQPVTVGKTGYAEIVDQNGLVVARTQPGQPLSAFELSDHPERFAALISGGKPTVGRCHTCHEAGQQVQQVRKKDVLAFVPLSEAPWGVAIRQSEREALSSTHALRRQLLTAGFTAFGLFLLVTWVTTRDIIRRIGLLSAASRRMATGDLASAVVVPGKDEIGLLASSIDEMRTKLDASYKEVKKRSDELTALLSVSRILTSPLELSDMLKATVSRAVEVIPGANGGVLFLRDSPEEPLSIRASAGLDTNAISAFSTALADFARNIDSVGSDSGKSDPGADVAAQKACAALVQSEAVRSHFRAAISAPILSFNECLGALILVSVQRGETFTRTAENILQAVVRDIAVAVEKDRLSREAKQVQVLRETDRLKSLFISSVSHELRTPLTSIKGFSTSLLRPDVSWDKETKDEFLETIDEKTDDLLNLIDKLLEISRLEAGGDKLAKEPVLLYRIARKVADAMASRTRGHEIVLEFPPNFPVIEADARHMEQVLQNLVENAIKYSPGGGKIKISGHATDRSVRVCVSDEGIGIPPDDREKVFERFYRVNDPVIRATSGSGLGLAIVRELLRAHGGTVELESELGKGTTFCFSLPLEGD